MSDHDKGLAKELLFDPMWRIVKKERTHGVLVERRKVLNTNNKCHNVCFPLSWYRLCPVFLDSLLATVRLDSVFIEAHLAGEEI